MFGLVFHIGEVPSVNLCSDTEYVATPTECHLSFTDSAQCEGLVFLQAPCAAGASPFLWEKVTHRRRQGLVNKPIKETQGLIYETPAPPVRHFF